MSKQLLIKDSIKYLLFSEIYLRYKEPKAKRRAFSILEAAITCFDRKGFENVTLKSIAREAAVSAPLLRHYFTDLKEIRETSLKYIRLLAQKFVVNSIGTEQRPDHMLKKYLQAHYSWSSSFKSHIRVWLSFLSISSKDATARELNTLSVLAGNNRISELLASGREVGCFTHSEDRKTALIMQALLLGWLISLATEVIKDPDGYTKEVIRQCLSLVGAEKIADA